MRIHCPFCGERSSQEFIYRGDAAPVRPESEGGFADYVYARDNVAGLMAEHWYHAQACRQWLRVTRDTATHEILDVSLASKAAQ
jgi:sarcosine oxidase subunit delta